MERHWCVHPPLSFPLFFAAVFASLRLRGSLILLLFCSAVRAADEWPQFRGPTQQGWAGDAVLATHWSEADNIKWKTPIPGLGWSSPVIFDNQIWMTTATGNGRSLRAVCVDRESGRIIHDVEVFAETDLEPKNTFNSYASPTPVIERGRVYVSFGTYGNACLDTATADVLWKNTDLHLNHMEGPGSSPILWGKYFLIHCDGTDVQYLAALDKNTGQLAYKAERSYPLTTLRIDMRKAFSIPTVATINGKEELISVGARRVYGYDPADGTELWHCDIPGFSNAPRPVVGDGLAFISTGYMNAELWAINPSTPGPDGVVPVVWKLNRGAPLKPSVLLVGDLLYLISDRGIARCLEAKTGQQLWQARLTGPCSASPIYANGLIYFFDEQGKCAVIRAGSSLQNVAENNLDGRILASPAVAGNSLFVRTDQALYRIENSR
jgi:outer membrane protein assembly factor BamB